MGTCGWSDATAPWNNLHHHSHGYNFGCVEIDSTCYNYPSLTTVSTWINSTPSCFLFHIKLFGFLCSRGGNRKSLPKDVRSLLNDDDKEGWVTDKELPTGAIQKLWDMSNAMLTPFVAHDKMGVVLLQFHTSFHPNSQNSEYIRRCRRNLRSDVRMAIEFRDRNWLRGRERKKKTMHLLQSIQCGLVASDDLEHEVKQRDRNQQGLLPHQSRVRLRPVVDISSTPEFLYCRVHRRHGDNRLLLPESLQDWSVLLKNLENKHTCIYFLWGTDHRDQPVTNGRRLLALLPESMQQDWQAELMKMGRSKKGSLLSMLSVGGGGGGGGGGGSGGGGSSSSSSSSRSSKYTPKVSLQNKTGGILSMFARKNGTTPATSSNAIGVKRKEKKIFRYSIGGGGSKKQKSKSISNFFNKK